MTSEDTKIESVIQRGLDNYLNNYPLRNAICQIPGIGSMLDYVRISEETTFTSRQYLNEAMSLIEEVWVSHIYHTEDGYM